MSCYHLEQMRHDTDLAVFHAVLAAGSFSGAARQLGLTHSAVSKRINSLEERLGVALLVRTTRQMRLTEAGEIYAAETAELLARLEAVENEIVEGTGAVRGRIRVTTSNALGEMHVVPLLLDFMRAYPQVEIDLTLTDAIVDVVRSGVDLAIRSATLQDSSLIARKLMTNRRVVCASADYVARHGAPESPSDLADHACLRLNLPGAFNNWGLRWSADAKPQLGRGFACNSLATLHFACLQAHGIAWLPMFLVSSDLKSKRLVPLLDGHHDPASDTAIAAVWPAATIMPKRTRTLIDFLAAGLGKRVP
jgi:DNA-binding transcriptional LysR family regulator